MTKHIDEIPELEPLHKVGKRLGIGADCLRKQLPVDSVYKIGKRYFVDVDEVSRWLLQQRERPGHSALRVEFARRAGRRQSALRPDSDRSDRGSTSESARA